MVRMVHTTNGTWYEWSNVRTHGSNSSWYEWSVVRMVHGTNGIPVGRVVTDKNYSPVTSGLGSVDTSV